MIKRIAMTATLLLALGSTSTALAGPVITSYSGGSPFAIFYGGSTGDVIGYSFTADVNLTVTDLGVLIDPADGVVDSAHMVGVWRLSDQALLGSVSVDGAGTVVGDFVYAAVGPFNLAAGVDYVLGAMYAADDDDSYLSGPVTMTTDNVSMTEGRFPSAGSLGFVFPELNSPGNLGRLGPNMIAEPINGVPEPASLALLGLGLTGLAMRRRRLEKGRV